MTIDQIKDLINSQLNQSLWWLVGFGVILFLKNAAENFVWGLVFIMSRDFSVDDIVYINGTRKARIARQTITKTVFYLEDEGTRLIVLNKDFASLRCEKILPKE